MTVSSAPSRVQHLGNAVTTVFTGPALLDASHIEVYEDTTLKTITTDYLVTNVGMANSTITFVTAPASGVIITLARVVPLSQTADYVENDPFPAATHETALDKLTQIEQQQQDELVRSLKFPVTDAVALSGELPAVATRADKVLAFDSAGNPTVSGTDVDNVIAAEAAAVAAAASAAAAAASAAALPLNNFTAITTPGINDDSGSGYSIGSRWVDLVADESYICVDATVGGALWPKSSLTTDELGSAALATLINSDTFTGATTGNINSASATKNYIDANKGSVVQRQSTLNNAASTNTGTITIDDSLPQNTEGTEVLTVAITPTSATNKLAIKIHTNFAGGNTTVVTSLFQDTDADALACCAVVCDNSNLLYFHDFGHEMVAGGTSEIIFKVRVAQVGAGTTTINGVTSTRRFGGALASSIEVLEIKV